LYNKYPVDVVNTALFQWAFPCSSGCTCVHRQ